MGGGVKKEEEGKCGRKGFCGVVFLGFLKFGVCDE